MKTKNVFWGMLLMLVALFTVSCSTEDAEDFDVLTPSMQKERVAESVLHQVDSLNASYAGVQKTRGFWGLLGKQAADWAGKLAGRYIYGKVVKNKENVYYHRDEKCVARLCSVVSSYVFCALIDGEVVNKKSENPPVIPYVKDVFVSNDSIGAYHNKAMEALEKNRENYFLDDGLDYDLLYSDCLLKLKEMGAVSESFYGGGQVKEEILGFAIESGRYAQEHKMSERNYFELVAYEENILKTSYGATDDDLSLSIEFGRKVMKACSMMDAVEIQNYAEQLGNVIRNSSLAEDQKRELIEDANIIIASTMCWY